MASAPRWKTVIETALSQHKDKGVFQLATVDASGRPHVRSHIHREFFTSPSTSKPLLITTTDIRTPKADQIKANQNVELAWWIDATQEQFRITGKASLIPASGMQISSGTPPASSFDWEPKRREVFDSLSGHMKASWCRPIPGTPMPGSGSYDEAKKWVERLPKLGEASSPEEQKNLDEALKNFALLLVDPEVVDYVELGVVPNQRTAFKFVDGQWKERIVVP